LFTGKVGNGFAGQSKKHKTLAVSSKQWMPAHLRFAPKRLVKLTLAWPQLINLWTNKRKD